jgi:hypothetical protein
MNNPRMGSDLSVRQLKTIFKLQLQLMLLVAPPTYHREAHCLTRSIIRSSARKRMTSLNLLTIVLNVEFNKLIFIFFTLTR